MRRLGVQLVIRSPGGVVVPIAITSDASAVKHVADCILKRMKGRRFDDEILDLINKDEECRLAELLHREGLGLEQKNNG